MRVELTAKEVDQICEVLVLASVIQREPIIGPIFRTKCREGKLRIPFDEELRALQDKLGQYLPEAHVN